MDSKQTQRIIFYLSIFTSCYLLLKINNTPKRNLGTANTNIVEKNISLKSKNIPHYLKPLAKLNPTQHKVTKKNSSKDEIKKLLSDENFKKNLNKNMDKINFVQNIGQFDKDVLYAFNTTEAQMFLFENKIRLISSIIKKDKTKEKQLVDIQFPLSNHFKIEATSKEDNPEYSWFTSEGNYTGIKSANELKIKNIYDGIDLRLYSNENGSLEFDWIVQNAADYQKIKMQLSGQDSLSADSSGNLLIHLKSATMSLNIPATYQINKKNEREDKNANFLIDNNIVAYTIKQSINPELPLVIDPKLQWGSFMDGSFNKGFSAYLYGGDIDKNGDLYLCGSSEKITKTDLQTASYGFPIAGYDSLPPSGTFLSNTLGVDWLIMKVKNDGSKVLNYTFYGASNNNFDEKAFTISVSPENNSIMVGGFIDGQQPNLSTMYINNTSFSIRTSGYLPAIAIFSSDLKELKYRSFIGGVPAPFSYYEKPSITSIEAINDSSYIIGATVYRNLGYGLNDQSYTSNGIDTISGGGYDMYVGRFSGFNHNDWGTFIGGNSDDKLYDLRLLQDGGIVFCGSSKSTNNSFTGWNGSGFINEVANNINRNNGSNSDGIVGVIKADGSAFNMLSKVGGNRDDEFNGLAVGPCNTLYLCGSSTSTNFPNIGSGVIQSTNKGSSDIILFKCSADGGTNETTATYYGGSSSDIGNSIAYLPIGVGRLFIFNSTQSTNLVTKNTIQGNTFYDASANGGYDLFFIQSSTDFKQNYLATYLGGNDNDYLGNTGVPVTGKQMQLFNDTILYVFTTTHSRILTPNIISTSGVFDNKKDNFAIDSWTIFGLNFINDILPTDAGDAPITHGRFTAGIALDSTKSKALLTLGHKVDDDKIYPKITNIQADIDDANGNSIPRRFGNLIYYNPTLTDTPFVANDEDAITQSIEIKTTNTSYSIDVPFYNNSKYTCNIYGYIDFNGDGDFDNLLERVEIDSIPSNDSINRKVKLIWDLSNCSIIRTGHRFMRLVILRNDSTINVIDCGRYTSTINGGIGTGEVEDYPIEIKCININDATLSEQNVSKCYIADGKIIIRNADLLPNTTYNIYYTKNNIQYGPILFTSSNSADSIVISNLSSGTYSGIKIESRDNPLCCKDSLLQNVTIIGQICPININDTVVYVIKNDSSTICVAVKDDNLNQIHTSIICKNPAFGTVNDTVFNQNNSLPQTVCIDYKPDSNYIGNDTICLITCNNLTPAICDTHNIYIIIKDSIIINNIKDHIFIPNAFSPNSDGNNDVFMVRMEEGLAVIEQMIIYDRWGNKVFERNNTLPNKPSDGWNGYYKNEIAQSEVYGYFITLRFIDNQRIKLKGNVTLLK